MRRIKLLIALALFPSLLLAQETASGCVASINIYRVDTEDESFVNVLHHRPICFEIGISDGPRQFNNPAQ